jgi:predicted metal-dependent hydrolase
MTESLAIGDLYFALQRSDRRKTVGITIDRGGELILTAPSDCPLEAIKRIAEEKRFWIYTKLAEKELLFHHKIEKEYVNGEGFYYLGRSYRLLITSSVSAPLRLHQGRFILRSNEQHHAQKHFINWYIEHAQPWLQRRVNFLADRIGVSPKAIQVRDLGFRWGSCSCSGTLNFHWRTILLPPRISEYIVCHELVHLHEPHHDRQFWQRLERAMPDFASRKQWLAENGSRF